MINLDELNKEVRLMSELGLAKADEKLKAVWVDASVAQ